MKSCLPGHQGNHDRQKAARKTAKDVGGSKLSHLKEVMGANESEAMHDVQGGRGGGAGGV